MASLSTYPTNNPPPPGLTEGRSTNNCWVLNRGPEVEWCIGDEGTDATTENDWSLLPFKALSDGAHAYDITITPGLPTQPVVEYN